VLKRNAASRNSPSRKLLYRLKTSNVLWSRNFHNREMVNSSSAHIRDCRMPEIIEIKTLDTTSATRRIERRFNRTDRLPLDQKHMVFMKVVDFIQALNKSVNSGVNGTNRPSLVLVSSACNRITVALRSTRSQVRWRISPCRIPA